MQPYSYRPQRPIAKKRRSKRWLYIFALIILVFIIIWVRQLSSPQHSSVAPANNNQTTNKQSEIAKSATPLPNVQSLVETWTASNTGVYSIVVQDLETKTVLAAYRADESYFAASIYKLYVAYLGLIDIQAGKYSLDDPFLNDWSRQKCLDEMIRNSYSPCAEKLWVEQGKTASTERLKKFGITGTNMEGLTTTAHDVDIILSRLHQRKELDEKHTQILLDAMKGQKYRDAIPVGVPTLTVYDKVGFRELVEYHDVAIVVLPNGRNVAITLLTKNAGTRRMADITKQIFTALQR